MQAPFFCRDDITTKLKSRATSPGRPAKNGKTIHNFRSCKKNELQESPSTSKKHENNLAIALKISDLLQTSDLVCVDAFALDNKSDIAELTAFQKPELAFPTRSIQSVLGEISYHQHGIGVALSCFVNGFAGITASVILLHICTGIRMQPTAISLRKGKYSTISGRACPCSR